MSKPYHIVIVGSGPAGLAAAIAITKHPSNSTTIPRPLRVTVLELRPSVQTIGGAVNMKPLTLRYLDALGAGLRLRPEGNPASAIDLVAHRTGALLATLWPGVDALRVRRHAVVEALMETALSDCNPWTLRIKHGAKVTHIEEYGDPDGMKEDAGGVFVTYTMAAKDGSVETETLDADVVVGCDGIHSFVRRHVVEPERPEIYSGKCVAYGFTNVAPVEAADWTRADGTPLVRDTTLVQHGAESLLMAYHELPIYRKQLYLAAVIPVEEATGDNIASGADDGGNTSASASVPSRRRDGWAVQDADKQGLRRRIGDMFAGGEIACLGNVIARCDDWFFYPVYMLPEGGRWTKGRVILLGDAAHAMPPQVESTGVAIEDGILLAHVLARRRDRGVGRMLADYDALRRLEISALYKTSIARWSGTPTLGSGTPTLGSWVGRVFMEWMAWAVVSYLNWTSNHFARDVRDLPLPK